MGIPLFDSATPLEPLRASCATPSSGSSTAAASSSVRRSSRFEREFAEHRRRPPRDRRRERHRRDHDRAAGDGRRARAMRSSSRRSRSTRRPRRSRHTGATPVFATSIRTTLLSHRRHRQGRADAEDQGRDRRAPVRQRRPGRRDRGAWRPGPRGRGAGSRLARPRRRRAGALGTARRSASTRRRTSAAFGDGGAITTGDAEIARARARCCASTARGQGALRALGCNSRLDAIQAAILRVLLPHLDALGAGAPRGRRRLRRGRPRRHVTLPATAPGSRAAWHLYVVRTPDPDALAAARRPRHRGARLLPRRRFTARRRCASDGELPAHRRRLRHQPRAADGAGADQPSRCGEVAAAVAEALAALAPALE